MKILGICGSLRQASYNRFALQAAIELAPAGMHVEVFQEWTTRIQGRIAEEAEIEESRVLTIQMILPQSFEVGRLHLPRPLAAVTRTLPVQMSPSMIGSVGVLEARQNRAKEIILSGDGMAQSPPDAGTLHPEGLVRQWPW